MKSTVARTCALFVLGCGFFVPTAQAQQYPTLERFAGGGTLKDTPAASSPVVPYGIALGPDGNVYVADGKNRLVRLDLDSGTATALPGLGPLPPSDIIPEEFRFWSGGPTSVAFDANGELYASTESEIFRVDLVNGELIDIAGWGGSVGTRGNLVFDATGTLYFSDGNRHAIRRRSEWGYLDYLVAPSSGGFWGDGEDASYAGLNYPRGVATDAEGNVYIADTQNNRVRKISAADNIITTVAGNGDSWGPEEDGLPATQVAVSSPQAVTVDAAGNLYIYQSGAGLLRKVSVADGTISTIAGNGTMGYSGDDGPATEASIDMVWGNLVIDGGGNIYLADMGNFRVRRIDAGTGIITTVLGNGTHSFCAESSPRLDACLAAVFGVEVNPQGIVFISDANNGRVRQVDPLTDQLSTFAGNGHWEHGGDGGPAAAASLNGLNQLTTDAAGNLYLAGGWGNRVRRVDAATNIITTLAGTGVAGFSGDGGAATLARFNYIKDVAVDLAGNLYVADSQNYRIRRVDAGSGVVTTIAGTGVSGFSGDGGPATAARLGAIDSLGLDAAGNLLFMDGARIRRIDPATGTITTIAGNGNYSGGEGGPATAAGIYPGSQFTFDSAGNIVIASQANVRRIDASSGIITLLTPYGLAAPEGITFGTPSGISFDAEGRLYIADSNSDLVFRVNDLPAPPSNDTTPPVISPVVNGVAGSGGWYSSDVQVSWSTSDPHSAISATSGCDATSVTSDTSGVTFTCSATSEGGTAERSVTIRRDTVAPTLTFEEGGSSPDAEGWVQWPPSVYFYANDQHSGVFSTSSGSPVQVTGEGAGRTAQVVVTDNAGNSATFTTPAFNIDSTPPSVGSSVCCNMSDSGWYNRDVIVDFSVEDLVSPIRSVEGCVDTTVVEDTAGVTFTCTATSAGGTQTHSLTIRRDTMPPQLQFGAPSPAPNASGWHAGDVSIPFTTSDALSGVASPSSGNLVITGEGANLTTSVVVTDQAGNSATFTSPPVSIDRSAPLVQPVIAGTLGNNGWYTSDVQVSWAITAAPGSILSSNGCGASSITTDTAGITFTCSVVSGGGSASQSVTIRRDATLPILTWRTPSPTPNAAGWIRANASFPFYAPTDALSGIASVSTPSPLVVSTEGVGVTGVVTVTDRAGNVAQFTSAPRNIDKTLPTIDLVTPTDVALYGYYSNVYADYSCADAGSGTATCSGNVADGAALNTRTLNGVYSFKVTAKDVAGNTATRTHAWSVTGALNFEGFLAPANNPPVFNLVNRGTRVPLRWRLPDGQGGYVTNTASYQSVTVTSIDCPADAVALGETTTAPAGISFDAGSNAFAYNWNVGASWSGCRSAVIRLRDGSLHELLFKVQ